MKKIITAVLCIVLKATVASAQADSLSVDENNKFIYYQVVAQSSASADTLYKRALSFFKSAYTTDKLKLSKQDKGKTTLYGKGGVLVAKKSAVTMHEDAKIDFDMVIEIKDNKYRYWLTDFVIIPYERDRYANFVPVAGKNTPLENGSSKLSKKDMDGYLQKVLSNSQDISNKLKSYMKNPVPQIKEIKKRSVTTKEW